MPIYEYICDDCEQQFEVIVRGSATPHCPACQGQHLRKQLSVFAVSGTRGDLAPVSAPSGTCGDPRGPGSCSVN